MNILTDRKSLDLKISNLKSHFQKNGRIKKSIIHAGIISKDLMIVKTLESYLSKISNVHLLCMYKNSDDFLNAPKNNLHVLFVDINAVDEISGIGIMDDTEGMNIIGIGARQQFEKINLNLSYFHFLQLPLLFGEVFSVIGLLKKLFSDSDFAGVVKKTYVLIKSQYKLIKISFDDILFIVGMKDYTRVHLRSRSVPLTTLQNLKEFEKKLPPQEFLRVHKSYIIAVNHIDCIARNEISIGNYSIPVGEAFRCNLNKFIAEYS